MLFIDNKYTNIYYSIIKRSFERSQKDDCYFERHHIIPKSLGGSNSKSNIALLSAREHFICHWLLIKMTQGEFRGKMVLAIQCMRASNKSHSRHSSKITSRVYETYRIEAAKYSSDSKKGLPPKCSGWNKGIPMKNTSKEKLKDFFTGRPNGRRGIPLPEIRGKNHTAYDHTKYHFIHESGISEHCTQHELRTKYGLKRAGISMIVNGVRQMANGWRLSPIRFSSLVSECQ